MGEPRKLQVNITRNNGGLNYSVNKLPDGERLVATMTYVEAVRRAGWTLQQIVTTGAIVIERGPVSDSGAISLPQIELSIREYINDR